MKENNRNSTISMIEEWNSSCYADSTFLIYGEMNRKSTLLNIGKRGCIINLNKLLKPKLIAIKGFYERTYFNHVLVDGMIVHGYIGYILFFHVPHPLFYAVFVESKSI